jgi:hypothetical protein
VASSISTSPIGQVALVGFGVGHLLQRGAQGGLGGEFGGMAGIGRRRPARR